MSKLQVFSRRIPINRSMNEKAIVTGGDLHEPAVRVTGPPGRYGRSPGTLRFTMAKAKRRKLRARRSKANHGRKPNAGRG